MEIYTLVLRNKETGQEIERDFDLYKLQGELNFESIADSIGEMWDQLNNNETKF